MISSKSRRMDSNGSGCSGAASGNLARTDPGLDRVRFHLLQVVGHPVDERVAVLPELLGRHVIASPHGAQSKGGGRVAQGPVGASLGRRNLTAPEHVLCAGKGEESSLSGEVTKIRQ